MDICAIHLKGPQEENNNAHEHKRTDPISEALTLFFPSNLKTGSIVWAFVLNSMGVCSAVGLYLVIFILLSLEGTHWCSHGPIISWAQKDEIHMQSLVGDDGTEEVAISLLHPTAIMRGKVPFCWNLEPSCNLVKLTSQVSYTVCLLLFASWIWSIIINLDTVCPWKYWHFSLRKLNL